MHYLYTLIILIPFTLNAAPKGIHGKDDRMEVIHSTKRSIMELSRSTMAMVKKKHLKKEGTHYVANSKTLKQLGVCEDQRFVDQLSLSECSGFFVGEDKVVTAGHCVIDQADCDNYYWVFDYRIENKDTKSGRYYFPEDQVYTCKSIVKRDYDKRKKIDYALINLDKEVSDRTPLEMRTSGKIHRTDKVFMIGHPRGIPSKYTPNGIIRKNKNKHYFKTTLDSFVGNSGSAVFNEQDNVVEGILVRSSASYKYKRRRKCSVEVKCREMRCYGSDVSRISELIDHI